MTIIAGGSRCNSRYFAWHLQRTDRGQTVAIRDMVGLMGQDMKGWFEQMEALSLGGRTDNFFYHFSLSPREGEAYTDEEREVAVATALRNLGLEGQPYFVVEHGGKDGRAPHYHCIALRVDLDTGKAISDSHNYDIHMRTADELEQLFDHERTERGRGPDGPNPKGYEVQRGQETGILPKDVRAELAALYQQADTGKAFAAALEERGYILARGDRRDFVVIDQAGDDHALGKRAIGAKAAEIRARLADVEREDLPSVTEARTIARERAGKRKDRDDPEQGSAPQPRDPSPRHDPGGALQSIAEELAESMQAALGKKGHSPPAEYSAPPEPEPTTDAPAPEPPPAPAEPPRPAQSLFDRLARELTDAAHSLTGGPTAAETLDPLAQSPPRSPPDTFAGHPEPTAFDWLASQFIREAKQAAPVVEDFAVAAAAVAEHNPPSELEGLTGAMTQEAAPIAREPAAEPAADAFERVTKARTEALRRAGGDSLFFTEGLAWRASEIAPASDPPPEGRDLTPFERIVQERQEALRSNGGEPYSPDGGSFWSRTIAKLREARDRALAWVTDRFTSFVERVAHDRNAPEHDSERER